MTTVSQRRIYIYVYRVLQVLRKTKVQKLNEWFGWCCWFDFDPFHSIPPSPTKKQIYIFTRVNLLLIYFLIVSCHDMWRAKYRKSNLTICLGNFTKNGVPSNRIWRRARQAAHARQIIKWRDVSLIIDGGLVKPFCLTHLHHTANSNIY